MVRCGVVRCGAVRGFVVRCVVFGGAGFCGPLCSVWRLEYCSFEFGLNILGPSFKHFL